MASSPEQPDYRAALRAMIRAQREMADAMEKLVEAAPAVPPPNLTGCSGEIVQTLRAVGHRLTGEQLHSEMSARGFVYSEAKVKSTAGTLVDLGQITNDQASNPKGYGLPEWPK